MLTLLAALLLAPLAGLGAAAEAERPNIRPLLRDPKAEKWAGPSGALTAVGGDGKSVDPKDQSFSLRTSRCRYSLGYKGVEELFDQEKDQQEWTNRASLPDYAAVKKDSKTKLPCLTGR